MLPRDSRQSYVGSNSVFIDIMLSGFCTLSQNCGLCGQHLCVLIAVIGLGFSIFALMLTKASASPFSTMCIIWWIGINRDETNCWTFQLHVFGIAAVLIIAVSSALLVTTFFGCCGACTENPCMMYTYGTMLALILLSLIGVAITVYVFRVNIRVLLRLKFRVPHSTHSVKIRQIK